MSLTLSGTTTFYGPSGATVIAIATATNPATPGAFFLFTVTPLGLTTVTQSDGARIVEATVLNNPLTPTQGSHISTVTSIPSSSLTTTTPSSGTSPTSTSTSASSNPPPISPSSSIHSLSTTSHLSSSSFATGAHSTASSTPTKPPASQGVSKSTENGLIAAVAVLGALLIFALIALLLLFRRKRSSGDQRGDYAATYVPKGVDSSPTTSLENTINTLETQLHERDAQLKVSQAALLQKGRAAGGSGLDDRHVNDRCSRLSKGINDWVLTHFKSMRPVNLPGRDVATMLQRSQPNYASLLGDPRARYLVIRSLVAEVLTQAFITGELLGNPAFSELKQTIGAKASPTEANEWRALTMPLLEKSPEYLGDRSSAVQEISKKIDSMTSSLAGLSPSDGRLNHLTQVVEIAASLAMDLAKQRPLFKLIMDRPGITAFDATSMEDVLQERKGDNLQGRPIQNVVFPAVKRWGDDSGNGYDREFTISKAQVLV